VLAAEEMRVPQAIRVAVRRVALRHLRDQPGGHVAGQPVARRETGLRGEVRIRGIEDARRRP
jgi:hypothetical protein